MVGGQGVREGWWVLKLMGTKLLFCCGKGLGGGGVGRVVEGMVRGNLPEASWALLQ